MQEGGFEHELKLSMFALSDELNDLVVDDFFLIDFASRERLMAIDYYSKTTHFLHDESESGKTRCKKRLLAALGWKTGVIDSERWMAAMDLDLKPRKKIERSMAADEKGKGNEKEEEMVTKSPSPPKKKKLKRKLIVVSNIGMSSGRGGGSGGKKTRSEELVCIIIAKSVAVCYQQTVLFYYVIYPIISWWLMSPPPPPPPPQFPPPQTSSPPHYMCSACSDNHTDYSHYH